MFCLPRSHLVHLHGKGVKKPCKKEICLSSTFLNLLKKDTPSG